MEDCPVQARSTRSDSSRVKRTMSVVGEEQLGRFGRTNTSADRGGTFQSATMLLACCDMRTLYLRNVSDEVVARLEHLAAAYGTSVNAVAVRELAEVSRRADNPALLGALPDLGVEIATIVADLDAERATR